MDRPAGGETPQKPPVTTVKLGSLTLTGLPAVAVLVVLLASIGALVAWMRPSVPILLSAALPGTPRFSERSPP